MVIEYVVFDNDNGTVRAGAGCELPVVQAPAASEQLAAARGSPKVERPRYRNLAAQTTHRTRAARLRSCPAYRKRCLFSSIPARISPASRSTVGIFSTSTRGAKRARTCPERLDRPLVISTLNLHLIEFEATKSRFASHFAKFCWVASSPGQWQAQAGRVCFFLSSHRVFVVCLCARRGHVKKH